MMDFIWLASYRKRLDDWKTARRCPAPRFGFDSANPWCFSAIKLRFNLFNSFWIISIAYNFQQLTENRIRADLSPVHPADDLSVNRSVQTRSPANFVRLQGILQTAPPADRGP
jgi:hypothetical protein